jgi:OOP family OmpA-OmpF porin
MSSNRRRVTTKWAWRKGACAGAAATAILHVAGEVWAQQGTALDRFDPAPVTGPYFAVPGAEVEGRARPYGGAVLSFAHAPLVVEGPSSERREVVDHQATLHVDAGIELGRRLLVDVSFAGIVSQGGETSPVAASPGASAAPGDLRLGSRVTLLPEDGYWPAAAMGVEVWLPTGRDDAYASAGVTRVAPRLVVGLDREGVAWAVTAAPRLLPASPDALGGSEIEIGAAGGPRFGPVWIGPEIVFRVDVESTADQRIDGEARLGAKLAVGPLLAGLAAGPGLGDGYGAPSFRALASIGLAMELAGAEREQAVTPVAQQVETRAARVPPSSRACAPGEATETTGCAPDADGDAIPDVEDACPQAAGSAGLDAKRNGCPLPIDADADGDGIVDASDACPQESGAPTADPKTNGCPTAVRFDGTQIVILQQVQFEVGAARLAPESDAVLGEVARVLAEHHEIARLAVDGHTDGKGDDAANLLLSQRRALAVMAWLVDHGVDARRLEARGFGERRHLADDGSPEGRAKNRRVEFIVRKRTTLGKAGWTDGPIE